MINIKHPTWSFLNENTMMRIFVHELHSFKKYILERQRR